MAFTEKDKVLMFLILPHLKQPSDDNTDEGEGGQDLGELYVVNYQGDEFEADDFKELTDYIVTNFEPGTYDIYKIGVDGEKEFYASFSFTAEEKNRY